MWLLFLLLTIHHPHPKPGSSISMIRQNQEIDNLNLPRIVDDIQLHQLEQTGELVRIPENENIEVARQLSRDRRYVRPWVVDFIRDMAISFVSNFRDTLKINSAVRTVEQQRILRRTNRFAAPENLSSHTAGITIDIAKRKYTRNQQAWIESYLTDMRDRGLIEFALEPFCYHIAVMSSYLTIH